MTKSDAQIAAEFDAWEKAHNAKFYANLASGYHATRMSDRLCPQGHQLVEQVTVWPEPYIINPPYPGTLPRRYQGRTDVNSEWCRECPK